ncbi:MAG: hypothetical protein ACYDG2_24130 [Ruminiclostridium sp.]
MRFTITSQDTDIPLELDMCGLIDAYIGEAYSSFLVKEGQQDSVFPLTYGLLCY